MAGIRIASYRTEHAARLALSRLREREVDTASVSVDVVVPSRAGGRHWWGGRRRPVPGRIDLLATDAVAPTAERVLAQWWNPEAVPVHVSEVRSNRSPSATASATRTMPTKRSPSHTAIRSTSARSVA